MFAEIVTVGYVLDYPKKRYKIDEYGRIVVVGEQNSDSQLVRDQTCVLSEVK